MRRCAQRLYYYYYYYFVNLPCKNPVLGFAKCIQVTIHYLCAPINAYCN